MKLDQVITGLTQVWANLNTVPGLGVTDGPDWDPPDLCLEVGWNGNTGASPEAALSQTSQAQNQARRYDETVDVDCLLSCHDGALTIPQARAILAGVFDALNAALPQAHPQGVWQSARITTQAYLPLRDEGGSTVSLRFTVSAICL